MAFPLTSSAFQHGADIPTKYTCDGENISPALTWSDPPEGTESLALIMDDPDAPIKDFCHWVLFNWPADAPTIPEALPASPTLDNGAVQGHTGFGRVGYGGPCPPQGPAHRYRFFLYALDARVDIGPEADRDKVLETIKGHILGEAQLQGQYQRRR